MGIIKRFLHSPFRLARIILVGRRGLEGGRDYTGWGNPMYLISEGNQREPKHYKRQLCKESFGCGLTIPSSFITGETEKAGAGRGRKEKPFNGFNLERACSPILSFLFLFLFCKY